MAAINKTMPKMEIRGPTGACSYPLLKELFQPSYQPNHQNTHAGNVSTQVFVIARRPIQKFCRKELHNLEKSRGADLPLGLLETASSPPPSSEALRRTGQPSLPPASALLRRGKEEEREQTAASRFGGPKRELFGGIASPALSSSGG